MWSLIDLKTDKEASLVSYLWFQPMSIPGLEGEEEEGGSIRCRWRPLSTESVSSCRKMRRYRERERDRDRGKERERQTDIDKRQTRTHRERER